MDKFSAGFIAALENNDLEALQTLPKSDLHNHSMLGSPFDKLAQWYGKPLTKPPARLDGISGLNRYLTDVLQKVILTPEGFEYALKAAFRQAVDDSVTVLEMSIDIWFLRLFGGNANEFTAYIRDAASQFDDKVYFIPQLGFDRQADISRSLSEIMLLLDTGYFRSIDLYGEELARGPEDFREIYLHARKAGLRLKAHAGEIGDAASVRHAVEVLGLDEVQHGINAAYSEEVMRWLKERGTQLNVCPGSNVALGFVSSLQEHPARILVDNGIKVTLNTDDIMVFGNSASDEYLNLYQAGTFTATELDELRCNGLRSLLD